jgi:tellurite resistance protein
MTSVRLFPARPIPSASFGAMMGVAGLGLIWQFAAKIQGAPAQIGQSIIVLATVLFATLLVMWAARILANPQELRAENNSAITASYFGSITLSCSLLAAGLLPYSRVLAFVLWLIAAFGGPALLIYLLGRWIENGIQPNELTPAIFIPVVGNAIASYAAVPLGWSEMGWALFSIALLCWLTFVPIVMYRLLTTPPPLPRKMAPQLAIMVASPAVIGSSWYALTGSAGPVTNVLAYTALFFALLIVRLWRMAWGEAFNIAMWGYTFPAAALAGVFQRVFVAAPSPANSALACATLALATLIVAWCTVLTLKGWARQMAPSRQVPIIPKRT